VAYDIADVVPLTVTIKDAAGTATNATTVTLTITLPDGTTITPAVVNPPAATGVYLYDYPTVQAGRHIARWTSTGPQAAYSDAFDVRPAQPAYIVSLADIKQQLNMTGTKDDEELRVYLEATTGLVENHLGRAVVRRTFTEEHAAVSGELMLNWTPVQSLTSVATVDGVTTWNVADLHVSTSGIVTAKTGVTALSGDITTTYIAGDPIIPGKWTLAARIIVQWLWETQRGTAGGPRPGGMELPGAGFSGFGYDIPPHAAKLLSGRLTGV
jgi:hypothetical protein